MRVIFLGSPANVIAPLQGLLDSEHEVVAVVSQPAAMRGRGRKVLDPAVAEFAKEKGIEVLQPQKASDPEFLQRLRDLKPDVAITAAYGQILNQEFLDIPKRATINIHPSLLPKHRGATPVQNTLLQGECRTGVSILFTVKALDAGNLILQSESEIENHETALSLMNRLFDESKSLLIAALKKLEDLHFVGEPQNVDQVTHCTKIAKQDGKVDWGLSAQQILNRYRAFQPWPGIYSFHGKKRIVLEEVELCDHDRRLEIGAAEMVAERLYIQCRESGLWVSRLKPEGKKSMESRAYWNGADQKNLFHGGE